MYVVVEFTKEGLTDYVPNTWLFGRNECFWPKKNISRLRDSHPPAEPDGGVNWEKVPIRIIGKAESLEIARLKAKKSEDTSDLTEPEIEGCKRKRNTPVTLQEFSHFQPGPSGITSNRKIESTAFLESSGPACDDTTDSEDDNLPSPPKIKKGLTLVPSHANQDICCSGTCRNSYLKMEGMNKEIFRVVLEIRNRQDTIIRLLSHTNCNSDCTRISRLFFPNENTERITRL